MNISQVLTQLGSKPRMMMTAAILIFSVYGQGKAWAESSQKVGVTDQQLTFTALDSRTKSLTFKSFDGSEVNGTLKLPKRKSEIYPLMLSLHGMGRSQIRSWESEYNGRPTIENTDKAVASALEAGFAVIALDARLHGERKVDGNSVADVIKKLRAGDPESYLDMIQGTVKDYQILLNALLKESMFDLNNISVMGYSMGAQTALLLAANNEKINQVVAMVPPYIKQNLPAVSPVDQAGKIDQARVLLFTSTQDQYATDAQNAALFDSIASQQKTRIVFETGHLLPAEYVTFIGPWLKIGTGAIN